MKYFTPALLIAWLFSACDPDLMVTGNNPASVDMLNIEAEVPEQVKQGSEFDVLVTVKNEGEEKAEVTTPHSCLYNIKVYKDDEPVKLEGTQLACATVVTTHEFESGEKQRDEHVLRAKVYNTSDEEAEMVTEGEYELVIKPETDDLPEVSAEFEVTESTDDASSAE